jgi:hypothetical protein
MGVLSKGTDFTNGDQVTDTSLDNLVDNATFTTSAVDEVSTDIGGTGAIIVKDEGITTGKLANSTGAGDGVTTAKIATAAVTAAKLGTDAVTTVKILDANVTTAKIADANVTKAKIENLTDYTVLGNVSGGAAAPAEVTILDEDTLVTDSATALATQQSIKAYVDSTPDIKAWCVFDPDTTGTNAPLGGSGVTSVTRVSAGNYTVNLSVAAPSATYACFASSGTDNLSANLSIGAYALTASTAKIQSTDAGGNFLAPEQGVSFSAIW